MTLSSDLAQNEHILAQDRAALAAHLAALKSRISLGSMPREIGRPIAAAAGPLAHSAANLAKANPLALGVTAAGLAWLLLGPHRPKAPVPSHESLSRWEDEGGTPLPETETAPKTRPAAIKTLPRKGAKMIQRHPFVASAAAMALGSLLGSFLPRTKLETTAFGSEAARLRDEAMATLAAERQRAATIARDAAEELKTGLRASLDTAVSEAVDTVERVGAHVVDQAVEPHLDK
jgi:ATP-dependent exoDNAse (exonuclease V) beta subunit